ncbi:MAG: hypothetical protein ACRC4T_22250 [Cetobacterium sp.]
MKKKSKEKNVVTEKETIQNLKTILADKNNIPPEHILAYMKKNIENEESLADLAKHIRQKMLDPKKVILENEPLTRNKQLDKLVNKLLKKAYLGSREWLETRKEMDMRLATDLSKNEELSSILKTKKVSQENIEKMYSIIYGTKEKIYKEMIGGEYLKPELIIKNQSIFSFNDGKNTTSEIIILKNSLTNLDSIKNTIVHELTHTDQDSITNNELRVPELEVIKDIFKMNEKYYISKGREYSKQVVEVEAFQVEKNINRKNEEGLKIEKSFKSTTGNLEDPRAVSKPDFKDVNLIYGARSNEAEENRDKLVLTVKTNKEAPLIADSYLDTLNTYRIKDDYVYMTKDLKNIIESLNENNRNDLNEEILKKALEYKKSDEISEKYLSLDKVNENSNLEIMKELLKKEEVVKSLKEIKKISDLIESNSKLTESEIDGLEEKIEKEYEKFFTYKTITIAEKVLNSGGKIYFTLDTVATSRDEQGKLYLDTEKLESVLFDSSSEHYSTITSQELRVMYENYLENPGLKFLIDGQVIVFPELKHNLRESIDLGSNNVFMLDEKKEKLVKENQIKQMQQEFDENKGTFDRKFKELGDTKGYTIENGIIKRNVEESDKQMTKVLENNVPKEHIQEFLANTILNKETKQILESLKEKKLSLEKNNKVLINDFGDLNPILLGTLYSKITDDFLEVQSKIDKEMIKKLSQNEKLTDLMLEGIRKSSDLMSEFLYLYHNDKERLIVEIKEGKYMDKSKSDEDLIKSIYEVAKIVQNERKKIFEKETGIKYNPAKIKLVMEENTSVGSNFEGEIKLNLVNIKATSDLLDTILHETTHYQQDILVNSIKTPEKIRELYSINKKEKGYINPEKTKEKLVELSKEEYEVIFELYKNQPREKGAHNSESSYEILNKMLDEYIEELEIRGTMI